MDDNQRLHLQKMISANNVEDTTDLIRQLKHSHVLRDNVNNQNKKYLKELKSIIQINEHPNTRYINEYGLLLLLQKSNNQIAHQIYKLIVNHTI